MGTYSIYLDDLDLALLPVQRHSYNFHKKELFEFQTLIKEEAEDRPVHTNHPCHICTIDVPAAFWSAHCASAKHQANARIATAAAQRMSTLVTATPPLHIPRSKKQFCDSCTCIAGKNHENTKEHKLSVIQDRMLNDLAMIYTGDDVNNDRRDNEMDKDSKDTEENKDIAEVDLNVAENENRTVTKILNENKTQNADEKVIEGDIKTIKSKDTQSLTVEVGKSNAMHLPDDDEKENGNVTKILIENKSQNDENIMGGDIKTIKSKYTQSSTVAFQRNNAMHLPDQKDTQNTASEIPEVKDAEVIVKKSRTRRRRNINQLESEINIISTDDASVDQDAAPNNIKKLKVSDQNNKGLDIKDAFVSYYPLVDENAVHYPFVKEMLQVRCLICDCIVPRGVFNRVTHLKGRPHAANAKKQLHIVKDAFILAKKQINEMK